MDTLQRLLPQGLPVSLQVIAVTLILGLVYSVITKDRPFAGFPIISLDGESPRKTWMLHGQKALAEGMRRFSGPFQVITGTGPKIIVPNRFTNELRNHPSLSFSKAFTQDFPIHYPGFEPLKQGLTDGDLVAEVVRVKLTQSLNLVTGDLVEETAASLRDIFGDSAEWRTFTIREAIADVVARLSSRVFLGTELCRNERWLDIAKSYTVDSFTAAYLMRASPPFLRPLTYWLLPQTRRLRRAVRDAREMIEPVVERRKAAVDAAARAAAAGGEKPPKTTADTLGWLYEIATAKGLRPDYTAAQLSLTMAAIHTTTEATCQALLDICEYPDVADQLRREVIDVLSEAGWAKTSLYKLKLMDSFIKEGQRVRPMAAASMNRYVERDLELSDGTVLPKGARIAVGGRYADPALYADPERFDAARFLRLREQAGQEHGWQFVTTAPAYLLFGHGQHACPGRFFASNEVKIALCHFLLKYDWRFVPGGGGRPQSRSLEASRGIDPAAKVQARRRTPEIDLDRL
ncbi:hypothetical protein SLS62_006098 [Diatrype stigma]|uniref:Cytochrome P450 monooxygenase n=1 Tax=Diatrype stigma TaxID=117547 RepID=A0AAN9YS80_9PEZI